MFLNFFRSKDAAIKKLAESEDFTYIDFDTDKEIMTFLSKTKKELRRRLSQSFWKRFKTSRAIRITRNKSKDSNEAIARGYDKEYETTRGTYGYVSAILSPKGFLLITGKNTDAVRRLNILDVGAGSNEFLRFCKNNLNVPVDQLYGIDVSQESKRIIEADGCVGYVGTVKDLPISPRFFDVVYLSYFIDYDTDQASTFRHALRLVKPGGVVVLEGLFPVRPFALLEEDKEVYSFVTKGETVCGDIELVRNSFQMLGAAEGRVVSLTQVVKSHRFVASHYGFNRLPSYFLTFSVL